MTAPKITYQDSKPVAPLLVGISGYVPGLPQVLNHEPIKGLALGVGTAGTMIASVLMMPKGTFSPGMEGIGTALGLAAGTLWVFSFTDGLVNSFSLNRQYAEINNLQPARQYSIQLGMSSADLRRIKGNPIDINRTTGSFGIHEQWVYRKIGGEYTYFYFENDYLTVFQD